MNARRLVGSPSLFASITALALVTGCDDSNTARPPKTAAAAATTTTTADDTQSAPPPVAMDGKGVETPGLHVSDAIARACNLPRQEVTPSFEYDSASIGDQDRIVLAAVAKCLSEGPLKGHGVALTGRADNRGEDEYNMTLGEARADSVRRYLHDLGVQQERLRATSRGELDATGTDESGWAHDRRVDIDLAN